MLTFFQKSVGKRNKSRALPMLSAAAELEFSYSLLSHYAVWCAHLEQFVCSIAGKAGSRGERRRRQERGRGERSRG